MIRRFIARILGADNTIRAIPVRARLALTFVTSIPLRAKFPVAARSRVERVDTAVILALIVRAVISIKTILVPPARHGHACALLRRPAVLRRHAKLGPIRATADAL